MHRAVQCAHWSGSICTILQHSPRSLKCDPVKITWLAKFAVVVCWAESRGFDGDFHRCVVKDRSMLALDVHKSRGKPLANSVLALNFGRQPLHLSITGLLFSNCLLLLSKQKYQNGPSRCAAQRFEDWHCGHQTDQGPHAEASPEANPEASQVVKEVHRGLRQKNSTGQVRRQYGLKLGCGELITVLVSCKKKSRPRDEQSHTIESDTPSLRCWSIFVNVIDRALQTEKFYIRSCLPQVEVEFNT